MSKAAKPVQPASTSNFIKQVIEADLASGKHVKIRTRFPPEPNGYLHLGHSKSILLNFGLAQEYGGACNLRFDDTNPEKEEQEYVDSIIDAVKWLGFDYGPQAASTPVRLLRLHVPVRPSTWSPRATPTSTARAPRR